MVEKNNNSADQEMNAVRKQYTEPKCTMTQFRVRDVVVVSGSNEGPLDVN